MIFQHTHRQVLVGSKTQTRRLVKPGENLYYAENGVWNAVTTGKTNASGDPRIKWQVGKTYAVQPGRGKKAIGRIRITGIRQEPLQDISYDDALDEGCEPVVEIERSTFDPVALQWLAGSITYKKSSIDVYAELWDSIHTKPGTRWADNPDVFVLEFEAVTP